MTTSPIFQKFIFVSGSDCDGTTTEPHIVAAYDDADEAAEAHQSMVESSDGLCYELFTFADLCRRHPFVVANRWEIVQKELIIEEVPATESEDDNVPILEGDEIRYRVPTGIEKRPFDGPFLGEVIGVFSKATLFNVRRNDGPVEWVRLSNVSAVFPKFK